LFVPYARDALRQLLTQAGLKNLKDSSNGFDAECPFHHTASGTPWGMNLEGVWSCLNPSCGETGNMQSFLLRVMRMSPRDIAAYVLPTVVEMPTESLPAWEDRLRPQVAERTDILPEDTLTPFKRCPLYMVARGFPKPFLREHEIGFDPDPQHPLWRDKVDGAAVFPVRDVGGALVGLSRRATSPIEPPYLHEYQRSHHLYLLHLVRPGDSVLITEGPVDALKARLLARQAHGILSPDLIAALRNAVSTGGNALTELHAELLADRYGAVWLGTDPDGPGRTATTKAIAALIKKGGTVGNVLTYPVREQKVDLGAMDRSMLYGLGSVSYWQRAR
jgi:hypothetical protein